MLQIDNLFRNTRNSAKDIFALGALSNGIGNIISVIGDIIEKISRGLA
ncbi:MAG: hypothetical protein QM401_12265 [Bacillota bacterium]|nr:hypothetical protein [Bacillota bacterium]HHU60564.1 hypothetical protein [Natronincola sp.]